MYRYSLLILLSLIFKISIAQITVDYDSIHNPVFNNNWPDPTIWRTDEGTFHSLCTGVEREILSRDMVRWSYSDGNPIDSVSLNYVKAQYGSLWAPDVVKIKGKHLLYLAMRNSLYDCCIAVFVQDKDGMFKYCNVITSCIDNKIGDTIDPEVVTDEKGHVWLFFGSSFGIHRVQLTKDGLHLAKKHKYEHVAGLTIKQSKDRSQVFEGAYLYKRRGYWYLFVSSGHYNKSDYRILCGRSRRIDGNFVDKNGKKMKDGYASVVVYSDDNDHLYGPGHNGEIFTTKNGETYFFYHCHLRDMPPKADNTYIKRPLFIQKILWGEEGWPYVENSKPTENVFIPKI